MSVRPSFMQVTRVIGVLLMLTTTAFVLFGCGVPPSDLVFSTIPSDSDYDLLTGDAVFYQNPNFTAGYSNPIAHLAVPQHPYLAPNGKSNMHADGYMTDTYEVSGPLGLNPEVHSTFQGLNQLVTAVFDSQGRLWSVRIGQERATLLRLDPVTLHTLTSYELPPRPDDWYDDPIPIDKNPAGGAYFCLNNLDQAVIGTFDQTIEVVEYNVAAGDFQQVAMYDLSADVVQLTPPARDKIVCVLPDWSGRLWWVSRYGKVGTVDPVDGIKTITLAGEQIQNSFSVAEDGVYIVSSHALYRFHADGTGNPVQDWRVTYDRGTRVKPGMIHQGSGTTPNVFGDLVCIGDNADPKMNMLFHNRSDGALVASIPVFWDGISCTENAPIGFARSGPGGTEYSIIVENNYGWESYATTPVDGQTTVGGVTRVDVVPDGGGGYIASEVWTSLEKSITTVPKMSLANGLVYLYTKPYDATGIDRWYLTAVDYATGQTVWRQLTGTGMGYNNNWCPITLSPDGGRAYIGSLWGLMSVADVP